MLEMSKAYVMLFGISAARLRLAENPRIIEGLPVLFCPALRPLAMLSAHLGDLAELIKEVALAGKPLLGICVGYQMLFDQSSEYGQHKGLGLVEGNVVPIPPGRIIPHMGWNLVKLPENMDLFTGLGKEKHFYFAHSFYADVADSQAKIAYTDYGFDMPAAVQKANIYGTQFHPEKSGKTGLKVLQNFAEICKKEKDTD